MQCSNNLKQIGLALHNYRSEFGSFPPIMTKAEDGSPLHSWRVLLLPYLEHESLYDQIDLNQPWDAPVNRALHAQCPPVFRCPELRLREGYTAYQAILDSNAWTQKEEVGKSPLGDSMAVRENVMVLELTRDHVVVWMNPHDPDWATHCGVMTNNAMKQIHRTMVAHLLLVDGSVRAVGEDEMESIVEKSAVEKAND